jgi:ribonuclease H2 subunit A
MDPNEDILEIDDAIVMVLDDETQETNEEGTSRPATSIISDLSMPESIDERDTDGEGEDENDTAHVEWIPASVHPNTPLRESYVYVSPRPTAEGPYVVGVDEAGRGPALGPMVYGLAFCPESFVEDLGSIGFDGAYKSYCMVSNYHLRKSQIRRP